ncbi:MAG: major capsid protein [Proteobacteria bacterium]|nr:major capsid protein [Pseudomonadota bacterium]MBU1640084.1 major capsid protein [Pseudomonadota bacterium]
MAIDIYARRTLLKAQRQIPQARTWLRDTFFTGKKEFDTKHVDIDIVKGKRKMAAFVSPLKEGKVVTRDGHTTDTFTPPYLKEKSPLLPQDFYNRSAGAHLYADDMSPEQRTAEALGEIMANLNDRFTRREEAMCAEAMNSGTVTCTGEGIEMVVDFGMPAENKAILTGTALWTDAASDPLENLVDWSMGQAQRSGLVPTHGVIGLDAWKALRKNVNFTKALDNRRINNGQIDPRLLPDGVSYLGTINEAGVAIDLYTYAEWYVDPVTTLENPMVPADRLWLGSTAARCDKLYGAIEDMSAGGLAVMDRFPKTFETQDPSALWFLLQSAPLMAMLQPDAFGSYKVV